MINDRPSSARRTFAFTLIETLSAVAIIAILTGLSVRLLGGLGIGTNGSRTGSAIAGGLLETAREEAIMRRTITRLVIDTAYDPVNPVNYLHRMTVAYLSPSTLTPNAATAANWFQANKWEALPANAYVYYGPQTNGTGIGTNPSNPTCLQSQQFGMAADFGGAPTDTRYYDYFEFNPGGQLTLPANGYTAQLIVAPGYIDAPAQALRVTGSNQLFGFAIFRLGQTEFFQNALSVRAP